MNDDRISEVYKGEIWTTESQSRARRRINWLCAQAHGERVLDLGCSQGIATILLAREGFDVTGVDVQASAIDYAQADLDCEPEIVRKRARFIVGEGTALPWPDDEFDTVLLGEVLEHQIAPDRVLSEVSRVLRPDGRLVLTTPFGYSPHHDHKQTFFARDVIELVTRHFSIRSSDISEAYFRIVADLGPHRNVNDAIRDLDSAVNAAVRFFQEQLIEAKLATNRAERRLREASEEAAENRHLKSLLHASTADHSSERARLTDHVLKLQAQLGRTDRERKKLQERLQAADDRYARKTSDLRERNAALRFERDVARWKLESIRQRRWWRIGIALSETKRRPWRLLNSIIEILTIASGASRGLPAPEKPKPVKVSAGPTEAQPILDGARDQCSGHTDASPLPRRLIGAGTVLDPDAERRLSFEWISQPVSPTAWREVLEGGKPEILLVNDAGWELAAEGSSDSQLNEMVRAFSAAGVPTVFWDARRGDSTMLHGSHALLFDFVFCSFPATCDAYRTLVAHDRVFEMAPAVQTRLFAPAGTSARSKGVIALEPQFAVNGDPGPLVRAARKIVLDDLPVERIPAQGADVTVDRGVALASREYKAAVIEFPLLTEETELRQVMEVVATNTPVLAGGTIPDAVADLVVQVSTDAQAREALRTILQSEELRSRFSHRAWRQVFRDNAIASRVDEMLSLVGVGPPARQPELALMVPTNRPHQLEAILDNVARQTYPDISLTLVLHGIEIDEGQMREMAAERSLTPVHVVRVREDVALGEVFNRGFGECDGDFVGKMDDDDYYGPEYASDLLAAFEYTSADIVGKWSHYAYSHSLDATVLRYPGAEHTYQKLLAISTLIIRRAVLGSVSFLPMPRGSGSQFLREAAANGAKIYSGDRFNYLYVRYSDARHQHTWSFTDYELTAKAQFICQGWNLAAVDA